MILEKSFMQITYDAKDKYIKNTESRYSTKAEELLSSNAYIQGRVDAVADMESLVGKYNQMLKEKNALVKELANIQTPKTKLVSPPISGPKKGKEGYVQHVPYTSEDLGL